MCELDFDQYDEVFRPGSPILHKEFLLGREQETKDLDRCLRRSGFHPIVIGNRGVGKTSLVVQNLKGFQDPSVTLNCNATMTWDIFARALLGELGINTKTKEVISETEKKVGAKGQPFGVGIAAEGKQTDTVHKEGFETSDTNPWLVFKAIQSLGKRYNIIIDEYDAIPPENKAVHAGVAALVKTFSDHSHECDSRLVIVGIAQSAADLLGEHESIERSAREVFLRPLRREDIRDFLTEAERFLSFTFSREVKKSLEDSSLGYPYFVHLVGLGALDAMVDRNPQDRTVSVADYKLGLRKAMKQAFQSTLRKYRESVKGLSQQENALIKELCSFSDPTRILRAELKQQMARKNLLSEKEFDGVWVTLQQERGLLHVSRTKDTIRFADPLMAPFLKAWFAGDSLLQQEDPRQIKLF